MPAAHAAASAPVLHGEGASSFSGGGGRGGGRFRPNNQYLDEARALYAVLSDGAPGLGYHVKRGLAVRDAKSKRLLPSSYTRTWRPARERHPDGSETNRVFNPYVLQKHILGNYDVAWQTPSWTSLVVLDIDRPNIVYKPGETEDPERELRANYARDDVLAAVWNAFGFDKEKQPVVLATPGGGYHVYLPLVRGDADDHQERTWPAAWLREHVEHHLNQRGLELRPGRLELFPSGIRLRAPCGAGMALLSPGSPDLADDLGLRPVHARWQTRTDRKTGERRPTLVRQIGPTIRSFLGRIEAARRPLDAWLERPAARWHGRWGPWGKRAARKKISAASAGVNRASQHNEDVIGGVGRMALPSPLSSPSLDSSPRQAGWLLYGAAFRERVRDLTTLGLVEKGLRHDAALKLCWHWGRVRGLDREDTLLRVREWLEGFAHASATRDRSPELFVRSTLREVAHYYDRHVAQSTPGRPARGPDVALRPLTEAEDTKVLPKVDACCRKEAALILRFLRGEANDRGRVPHAMNLSGQILTKLCGERRIRIEDPDGTTQRRRATVLATEELVRLGILALHTNYSVGRHGRLYTCWYQFGSGVLPGDSAEGELILATRHIEEGTLEARSSGDGDAFVLLTPGGTRLPPEHKPGTSEAPPDDADAPWWIRMYERRSFTPAEFFEGDERRVIPGPFRHRFPDRKPKETPKPKPPPTTTPSSTPPPTTSPPPTDAPPDSGGAAAGPSPPPNKKAAASGPLTQPMGAEEGSKSPSEPPNARPPDASKPRRAIDAWSEASTAARELADIFASSPPLPANDEPRKPPGGLDGAIAKAWESWKKRTDE